MNGVPSDEAQRGIIPRAISKILENAERLKLAGWEFELQASFIEIYNENLRDLLGQEAPNRAGKQLENSCIKHHAHGHTEVRKCLFTILCRCAQTPCSSVGAKQLETKGACNTHGSLQSCNLSFRLSRRLLVQQGCLWIQRRWRSS